MKHFYRVCNRMKLITSHDINQIWMIYRKLIVFSPSNTGPCESIVFSHFVNLWQKEVLQVCRLCLFVAFDTCYLFCFHVLFKIKLYVDLFSFIAIHSNCLFFQNKRHFRHKMEHDFVCEGNFKTFYLIIIIDLLMTK